jgi:Bacterial regulatory proteins, luxR family
MRMHSLDHGVVRRPLCPVQAGGAGETIESEALDVEAGDVAFANLLGDEATDHRGLHQSVTGEAACVDPGRRDRVGAEDALHVRSHLTNPQIGAQLFLSAHTVEWHLRRFYPKLGISSRKELRDALSAA